MYAQAMVALLSASHARKWKKDNWAHSMDHAASVVSDLQARSHARGLIRGHSRMVFGTLVVTLVIYLSLRELWNWKNASQLSREKYVLVIDSGSSGTRM
jgi:hypothetical protein